MQDETVDHLTRKMDFRICANFAFGFGMEHPLPAKESRPGSVDVAFVRRDECAAIVAVTGMKCCRETKPMTLFCGLHQKYEPKHLPPHEEGMCRQITSRKARCKFRARQNGFCGFHHPYRKANKKRKKDKKEKDSASNTTTNSSAATATETGATTKRVRLNDTACVCNGVDAEELEIVARIMKWPSFHTTQHNLSKEKVKQVLDKMVVLCGVINSKIVSNGNYEWKALADSERSPSKSGKTSNN